jgi:hypothetical protein
MNLFKSLAVPGLLCPLLLAAQLKPVSIAEVMTKIQALRTTTDFKAVGRLVRVTRINGDRLPCPHHQTSDLRPQTKN